jgi:hypothetical protein
MRTRSTPSPIAASGSARQVVFDPFHDEPLGVAARGAGGAVQEGVRAPACARGGTDQSLRKNQLRLDLLATGRARDQSAPGEPGASLCRQADPNAGLQRNHPRPEARTGVRKRRSPVRAVPCSLHGQARDHEPGRWTALRPFWQRSSREVAQESRRQGAAIMGRFQRWSRKAHLVSGAKGEKCRTVGLLPAKSGGAQSRTPGSRSRCTARPATSVRRRAVL